MEKFQIRYRFNKEWMKSNLKKLRLMSGKTIAEIAEEAKSTRESIYRWEDLSDSRCPSITSIVDLCNIFNVDITTLLFTEISEYKKDNEININKEEIEEGALLILSSFPNIFVEFFKNFIGALKRKNLQVNGESINRVKVVSQSYIAFKIPKSESIIKKPLHFLSIYPNVNRRTLRFVFTASKNEIMNTCKDRNTPLSESAQKLLSDDSNMGAYFTIGYRQRLVGINSPEAISELFIRDKEHSQAPNIDDIVEISLKTLWLVIEKKRG